MRKTVIHHLPLTRDPASPKQLFDASCFDSEHSLWRETTLIARGIDDLRFYYLASESSPLCPFVHEYHASIVLISKLVLKREFDFFLEFQRTYVIIRSGNEVYSWRVNYPETGKVSAHATVNACVFDMYALVRSTLSPGAFSLFAARRHRLTSHFLNTFISIFAP